MDIQISNVNELGVFVYGDIGFELAYDIIRVSFAKYDNEFEVSVTLKEIGEEDGSDEQTCDDCSAQQLDLLPGDTGLGSERTPGSSIEFFNRR